VSDTKEPKKRGAPKKAKPLEGRVAFRSSLELAEWLEAEGKLHGLDKGAMARTLLMELKNKSKKKK